VYFTARCQVDTAGRIALRALLVSVAIALDYGYVQLPALDTRAIQTRARCRSRRSVSSFWACLGSNVRLGEIWRRAVISQNTSTHAENTARPQSPPNGSVLDAPRVRLAAAVQVRRCGGPFGRAQVSRHSARIVR
jgi:hypothetical protein